MKIDCPKCKIPMRNIERLMMGPKFLCDQCDLHLWQRGEKFFKIEGSYIDDDGSIHHYIKKVKI